MDLEIDFVKFSKEDLKQDFTPTRIWINFWERGKLSRFLLIDVLRIFYKFNDAEIVMMNLEDDTREFLISLFQDYPNVKILAR